MQIDPSSTNPGFEGLSLTEVLQGFFSFGVVIVDADGGLVASTPPAQELLHLSGLSAGRHQSSALPSTVQSLIREVQESGRSILDRRVDVPGNGSLESSLAITALPVATGDDACSVVLLLKDLAPLGEIEQQMLRLNRLASIGVLSASMAHEIKNALVPVKTFVSLLLERAPATEFGGTVQREIERVEAIVGRILKFSAPAKPVLSEVHLHELLDHALRLVQHRVEGRLVTVERQFDAGSDALDADGHQLEQAFVNLLFNAVEAIGAEGTLTVTTKSGCPSPSETASFRVSIRDTGEGIPAENMESIFEPFFTTKRTGTGLGLAVTRRIIEEHGGSIRVESQPRKGTCFTIDLPFRPAATKPGADQL